MVCKPHQVHDLGPLILLWMHGACGHTLATRGVYTSQADLQGVGELF